MTLRRLMLGRSLREWREHAGASVEAVAAELGCTSGRVRHLENGRNVPSRPDLLVMANVFGVPEAERDALLETRNAAKSPGWWQTYRLPRWLASYVMLENEATKVRNWEGELIPGLLQTRTYGECIVKAYCPDMSEFEVNRRIDARLRRQDRLTDREHPMELDALVSEAAIARCAADDSLRTDQLRHLRDMVRRENINIRIVPTASGVHAGMGGGFALLSFPAEAWPETGYQEYNVGGHLVDDSDAVAELAALFEILRERALTIEDSARLIAAYEQ